MDKRLRDAEQTRTDILEAARSLFATRGIASVSIRDIAAEAGVSHGLVQQYFGTREKMVADIIKHEIDRVMAAPSPAPDGAIAVDPEDIRRKMQAGKEFFRGFASIIMRAELDGIEPEKMLDPSVPTPAMQMASVITGMQEQSRPHDRPALDPKLVSAYINATLFGFATLAPWLMTSVGLSPDEYEKRYDEIIDITIALIGLAGGGAEKKVNIRKKQIRDS
ncbi:MAG: TetR/AcrR family transcriptional regulator [Desulfuromonadales bacterium]